MKRLFLASSGLEYIKKFVGSEPANLKMLFIPTAGNLDKDVWWIDKDRDILGKMGFKITELDIASSSPEDQKMALGSTDIVYVAGGNTFYLLKQLRDTGFDKLLTDYVNNGGLYAGASAGALIAGVDIGPVSTIDEPEKVQGLTSTAGLGFVSIVPIPHYDMEDRTKTIDKIKARYSKDFEIILMTDDKAVVVNGDSWELVESKRSELEHEWFTKNHQ
jgi:dipeptidase E